MSWSGEKEEKKKSETISVSVELQVAGGGLTISRATQSPLETTMSFPDAQTVMYFADRFISVLSGNGEFRRTHKITLPMLTNAQTHFRTYLRML